jgi:hypothetical protein
MISNITDTADARIVSDDEIDDVAGGSPLTGFLIGFGIVGSVGLGVYLAASPNPSIGTRDSGGRSLDTGGGGAHESGPDDRM